MGIAYPTPPPPYVGEPRLPEICDLFAPHNYRVGYLLDGCYTSSRYAASWEAVTHFADMILLRHPEAEVVVEAIPAGEVLCAYEEPRFANLWHSSGIDIAPVDVSIEPGLAIAQAAA